MNAPAIAIESLAYRFPGWEQPALDNISLEIAPGEALLISGPTGCGKTTLLKCINGLIPHASGGVRDGQVRIGGQELHNLRMAEIARSVGLVFQSPEDQIISAVVEDEVAFGLENLGTSPGEIGRRVQDALEVVGLAGCRKNRVTDLSGGMKQRLAIAAVLAMGNRVLLLDEPISQLDSQGAQDVLRTLRHLREQEKITLVIVEHRLDDVVELCDRVVLLDRGRVVLDRPVTSAFEDLAPYSQLGLQVPPVIELFSRLGRPERPTSFHLQEVMTKLDLPPVSSRGHSSPASSDLKANPNHPLLTLSDVYYCYEGQEEDALSGISFELRPGETVALMGANGCGKSTLILILAGLLKPRQGQITSLGKGSRRRGGALHPVGSVGLVLQNPDLMLQAQTIREEVAFGPIHLRLPDIAARVASTLQIMTLSDLADRSPLGLSRGQRQRTATSSVLSMSPRLLLLDEPTTGQDRSNISAMMETLSQQIRQSSDRALVFSTHDTLTAAVYATRILLLSGGRIIKDGLPERVLADTETVREAKVRIPKLFQVSLACGLTPCLYAKDLAEQLQTLKGKN